MEIFKTPFSRLYCLKNVAREYSCIIAIVNGTGRKQDEKYIRRKKNIIATLRKPAKNRVAKNIRSQATSTRDYSTLLKPTKVWNERCKTQDPDAQQPRKLQYIKDIPRLYVYTQVKLFGLWNLNRLKNQSQYFYIFIRRYVQWRNKESVDIKDIPTFGWRYRLWTKFAHNVARTKIKVRNIDIYLCLFFFTNVPLFLSDDVHNKLWVNERWVYPEASCFCARSALQLCYKLSSLFRLYSLN